MSCFVAIQTDLVSFDTNIVSILIILQNLPNKAFGVLGFWGFGVRVGFRLLSGLPYKVSG